MTEEDLSTEEMLRLQRIERWSNAVRATERNRANERALSCIASVTRSTHGDALDHHETEQVRMFLAQAGWLS